MVLWLKSSDLQNQQEFVGIESLHLIEFSFMVFFLTSQNSPIWAGRSFHSEITKKRFAFSEKAKYGGHFSPPETLGSQADWRFWFTMNCYPSIHDGSSKVRDTSHCHGFCGLVIPAIFSSLRHHPTGNFQLSIMTSKSSISAKHSVTPA